MSDGKVSENETPVTESHTMLRPRLIVCELEIKDITEFLSSALYINCNLHIDKVTRIYGKRDHFNFSMVNI